MCSNFLLVTRMLVSLIETASPLKLGKKNHIFKADTLENCKA